MIPHSTKFDPDKIKVELKVGDAWADFEAKSKAMSERVVSKDETARFLLDVYLGITNDDEIKAHRAANPALADKQVEKLNERLQRALFNSPGADMASARGMLWGVLNAVTNDIDFSMPARTQENRLNSAWFGPGAAKKQRAWDLATKMVA